MPQMEETAPLRHLAQEGLPPPAQDGVVQANCTDSVKESQVINCVLTIAINERARLKMFTNL